MKSIRFVDITFGYNKDETLFHKFNFEFSNPLSDKGYIYALMGSSGSGKSTLLRLILGTLQARTGKINLYPDKPIVSYLPQEAILFDHLTPLENAMYFKYTSNYKKHFDTNLFQQLVDALDMHSTLEQSTSIDKLSGGQRQRICLIRALSIRPDIILLDEPTNGLDAEIKLQFLQQLRETIVRHNLLAVYITHNKIEAELISDSISYLFFDTINNNRVIYCDNIAQFIEKPPILEARKIFQYPVSNILKVHIDANELKLTKSDEPDFFYLSIEENNIEFSKSHGIEFEIEGTNSIYTRLKLSSGQYLLVGNKVFFQKNGENNNKMGFTGTFLKYNSSQRYENTIQLQKNRIVE